MQSERFNFIPLLFFLGSKACVLLAMIGAFYYMPYHKENHFGNKYYPPSREITLKHIFQTWDTNHYLYLAERGYSTKASREKIAVQIEQEQRKLYYEKIEFNRKKNQLSQREQAYVQKKWEQYEQKYQGEILQLKKIERDMLNSDAFTPLYPFLIFLVQSLFSCSVITAAVILSNLFSLGMMVLFYKLVANYYGEKVACWSVFVWCAYPYSFAFHIAYTEALFLFFCLLGFYLIAKDKWFLAGLILSILPLIRVLGLFICIPYFFALWKKKRSLFYTFLPIGGFLFYLILMHLIAGDAFIWMKAQEGFVSKHSATRILHLWDWFQKTFLEWNFAWFHPQHGVFDRFSFLVLLLFLYPLYKFLEFPWFAYVLCYGLYPAFTSIGLMSYGRYLVSVFPLFIWLGMKLSQTPKRGFLVLFLFLVAQCFLAGRMGLNYWVC